MLLTVQEKDKYDSVFLQLTIIPSKPTLNRVFFLSLLALESSSTTRERENDSEEPVVQTPYCDLLPGTHAMGK